MWEVYEFLAKGGPVMIPIALGSVTALAIVFERLWALRRSAVSPPKLAARVRDLVRRGLEQDAIRLCQTSDTPLGRVLGACLRYRTLPRNDIKAAIEDVGRREVDGMSRYLATLGAIGSLEPLLGLLGTVTGMIQAFRQVVAYSGRGGVDPSRLAAGIWEALITTAAGLVIAIPCILAHRYLAARAERFAAEMEVAAVELLDEVSGIGAASSSGQLVEEEPQAPTTSEEGRAAPAQEA
jgi:biopolymer transport protein ExbB